MTDREGLYSKYIITKADGTPVNDRCFILKPDKDPAAIKAIQAYAADTYDEQLRNDLYAWVGKPLDKPMQKPLTLEEANRASWVYFEEKDNGPIKYDVFPCVVWYRGVGYNFVDIEHLDRGELCFKANDYGKVYRCWASRPTDEERKAEAWKD